MLLRAHGSGAGTFTETSIAQCMRRSPQEEAAVRTRNQPALRWTVARRRRLGARRRGRLGLRWGQGSR
jgi:hypothetical protein